MCISVDLPEPDGPMTAVELAARHLDRDTAQRVHRGVALSVAAGDPRAGDHRDRLVPPPACCSL